MAKWLVKSEPDCYSYSQLEADQRTIWDGVSNALALKHLRSMKVGDECFYYHTGDEKAIVGIAKVVSEPGIDPNNEKSVIVDLAPIRRLSQPVPLSTIKANTIFDNWELVRQSRLSVMPVSNEIWDQILDLSSAATAEPRKPMGKRK